ncbi:HesB/IscA family protein [Aspergillus nidulans FGSC A4]|uniref:Iron-sulfur cluster assembly accessory protein Isa2, putative (AFU_orthologue AFUA_2G10370) n=1 Tax=Emericella nidulans (strain FGSC A4 / ATCC 38163 / CBS 112.46 / NRRL 194 / M139) TaxID=227321 RepID=C8V3G5_EMENI|nr:hypothetical protein [Aspergillus nidulans FGSC A4]CBF70495.1 TPA: iron-sulfur cluster assembly accessory protein Isa2, putative (AFU_orthologue; AFUA_2G10370) [Aspergillus nidulans FGSC A4]
MSRPAVSSAARQMLWARRAVPATPHVSCSSPTLNFASFCHASYRTLAISTSPAPARNIRPRISKQFLSRTQPRSAFSSTTATSAAQVTQNPRTDDDGNTLMVEISERAANRLRQITDPSSSPSATKDENPYHHLRITVTSGGCHGFQYLMSLEPASKIDPEEDTIFEAEPPEQGSDVAGNGTAKIVMDEPSLELLSGSTVDYTTELIGSQFKIVDNPRATSSCGCGTSFDVVD